MQHQLLDFLILVNKYKLNRPAIGPGQYLPLLYLLLRAEDRAVVAVTKRAVAAAALVG
jgi:hypothetical protein